MSESQTDRQESALEDPLDYDPLQDMDPLKGAPDSEAKQSNKRDPFANDPLDELPALEPEDAPELEGDPFAVKKRRDPFATDPLADLPALDPEQAPELESDPFAEPKASKPKSAKPKSAKPKSAKPHASKAKKRRDPFAADPLAELPALDPEDAPALENDPFSDVKVSEAATSVEPDAKPEAASDTHPEQPADPSEPDERPASKARALSQRPPPAAAWSPDESDLLSAPKADAPPPEAKPARPKPVAKPSKPKPSKPKHTKPESSTKPTKPTRAAKGETQPTAEAPVAVTLPEAMEQAPASDSRLEPPSPTLLEVPSSRTPWIVFSLLLVVGLSVAGVAVNSHLQSSHTESLLTEYLERAPHYEPGEVITRADALPADLRADSRVEEFVREARATLAVGSQREAAEELVRQAQAEPDLGKALKLCNRAIVTYDRCAEAHALRARLGYQRTAQSGEGDYAEARDKALSGLQEALASDAECGLAYWERARLRWGTRTVPKLRKQLADDLAAAERYSPQSVVGSIALGYALLLDEHDRRALGQFDAALERDPASVDALVGRARALALLGETLEADRTASEALKLSPGAAAALAVRGVIRWARGQQSPARNDLRAALDADPWQPEVWAVLSRLGATRDSNGKLVLKDLETRRAAAERTLELAPGNGLAHLTLGEIDESRGRLREAMEHYTAACKANTSKDTGAHLARGVLRVRQAEWAAGEADLAEVLLEDPKHTVALAFAGAADVELKRWRMAGKRLSLVLASDDPPAIAWRYSGVRALRVTPAQPQAAFEQLSKALEFHPHDHESRFYRAEALVALGRPAEARDDLHQLPAGKAAGRVPEFEAQRLLGHALFSLEDFKGAHQAYTRFLKAADPENPHHGLVQRRAERCTAKLNSAGGQDF